MRTVFEIYHHDTHQSAFTEHSPMTNPWRDKHVHISSVRLYHNWTIPEYKDEHINLVQITVDEPFVLVSDHIHDPWIVPLEVKEVK